MTRFLKLSTLGPAAQWAVRRALLLELALATLIAVFGFGAFGFDEAWYHALLPATQLPGIWLLTELGLCCGFANGLVISDVILNRYGGLTPVGVPLLFGANVGVLSLLLTLARLASLRWRSRSAAASALGRAG